MAARVHLGAVPIGRRTVPYRSVVHEPTNGGHPWSLAHFAVSQTISLSLSLSLFLFFFLFLFMMSIGAEQNKREPA